MDWVIIYFKLLQICKNTQNTLVEKYDEQVFHLDRIQMVKTTYKYVQLYQ